MRTYVVALLALSLAACAEADAAEPAGSPGRAVDRMPPMPRPVSRLQVEVLSGSGGRLPTFQHEGRSFVMGTRGERYKIRVRNPSAERVEAVVSVDGLDAIDGRAASKDKRGYVIEPFGSVEIEGFRTSMDEVAAFRFSSVRDSYAGKKGKADNVGVIGVAMFRERPRPVVVAPRAEEGSAAPPAAGAPAAPESRRKAAHRAGLGTGFGERRTSTAVSTSFERASDTPVLTTSLRYDDHDGLVAAGVIVDPPPDAEAEVRRRAEPFPAYRRFAEPP